MTPVFFAALKQLWRPNFFAMRGQKDNQKPGNTGEGKRACFWNEVYFYLPRNKPTAKF